MPMRFRSIVPYTMPGVLVLIGWWWYTSRKKERLISPKSSEVPPTPMNFKDPQLDGSNGLLHKEERLVFPNLSKQNAENTIISPIQLQDSEAVSLMEQKCDDHFCSRIVFEEVNQSSDLIPPIFGNNDLVEISETTHRSIKPHSDPESESDPASTRKVRKCPSEEAHLVPEDSMEKEALTSNNSKDTRSSPIPIHLSDAERPEPEGEVATHHSMVNAQEEILCIFKSAKTHSMMTSDEDCSESVQSSNKHVFISTPTICSSKVHDNTTSLGTSVDMHFKRNTHEMNDLELLAAGLITEVISAAKQEVLGTSSCEITPSDKPNNRIVTLAIGTRCSQQDFTRGDSLADLSQESTDCTKAVKNDVQPVQKLGSLTPEWEEAEPNILKSSTAQNAAWSTLQYLENPVLLAKHNVKEAAALAEDSACSTYHSEEGVSSDDLQSSMLENSLDVFKFKEFSLKETTQHQSGDGSMTKDIKENSDAVCDMKTVNRDGMRNGAHGTCEVDTDQSGGSDVNSMDSVDSGCTMGVNENQGNTVASSASEIIIWEIEVPKHLVGRLIGKQGRYVSFLKQNSGAKIYISTLPYTQEFQICHIEGFQQQVDKALSFIGKKFKDLDLTNLYAPPLALPSLPITSWLLLPSGVTVEVIVVNVVSAGHIFVQQHTHPTYHALRSLDQQMFLCYSQPGTPALPSPAEVGVICAAPAVDGAWWRAQVISFYKETDEVEIRYVDYGGYDKVKIDSLRQIRSDFVTLPFQGAEVLLDNIAPLPGEDCFSADATTSLQEMTRAVALLAQVSNYDNNTGLPLVHLWNLVGDEVISVNRTLADRGLVVWVDGF